jgi:hypothetical protein
MEYSSHTYTKQTAEEVQRETSIWKYYSLPKDVVNPISGKFLIMNTYICERDDPYLLVIVPSKPDHIRIRNAIRKTYGTLSRDKNSYANNLKIEHIVRLIFVIGKSNNNSIDNATDTENDIFKDILKVDMIDSYQNLTRKMLHAFKWINLYCANVTYILKADEDVFVNIAMLLKRLKQNKPYYKGNIFGHIFNTDDHLQVQRENTKWGVKFNEYPLDKYPPYAQGTSYTLTKNLIGKIVNTSQFLPYLHIEDVFITGIISNKIHGAQLVQLNGTSNWGDSKPVPCYFVQSGRTAQTLMTHKLMYATWQAMQSYNETCQPKESRIAAR